MSSTCPFPGSSRPDSAPPTPPNVQVDPHTDTESALLTDLPRPGAITILAVTGVFFLLLAGLFYLGWVPHQQRVAQAQADAREIGSEVPVVGVTSPRPLAAAKDVLLPCDIRPSRETAIYPRTNGYLMRSLVDIGDHVKAGDLLAEIDTPEVDADLAQAKASLQQAEANVTRAAADLDLAQRTLARFEKLVKSDVGGVTEQELDEKRAACNAGAATLAAAKATVVASTAAVQRLTVLQQFEKVYAPFAGTITTRNYDAGALLSPTSVGPGKELFRLVQTDSLRVFVNVPQAYVTNIKTGQAATLVVRNYPGRTFTGTVARDAGALDPTTRTLPVELHFPNASGELYAGMYGEARLSIAEDHPLLVIPSSAMIFSAQGLEVALVQDNKVHYQKIAVGRDMGTEMEITSGLSTADQVISNPGQQLGEGLPIKVLKSAQTEVLVPVTTPAVRVATK